MQATQLPGRSREGIPDVWCLGGMPESSLVASAVSERTGNVTQKALPCRSSRGPADPRRGETAGARLSVRDGPLPPQTWRFGKPPGQLVLCPLHLVVRLWSRASLDTGGTRTGQMAGSPRAQPAARTARTARTSPCRCAGRCGTPCSPPRGRSAQPCSPLFI